MQFACHILSAGFCAVEGRLVLACFSSDCRDPRRDLVFGKLLERAECPLICWGLKFIWFHMHAFAELKLSGGCVEGCE